MQLIKKINSLFNSEIFKHSASYTILNFLEKALPFLVLPILTRTLSIEDVGMFILYQALIEILMPILTLSIDNTILLNYYKLESIYFKRYFTQSVLVFFILFFVSFVFILAFRTLLSQYINFPSFWLPFIIACIFFRFFTQNRQNIWRVQYNIKNYSRFTILLSLLNNLLGIGLVLFTDIGWPGMIIGHLFGYAILGCYAIFTFFKQGFISINKLSSDYINDILKVSYPISLHRLGIWLGSSANKMIIAAILGAAATGSYGIGAVFATIVTMLEDSISKAVIPHFYEKLKSDKYQEKQSIVGLSYKIYAFLLLVSIMVYLIGYLFTDIIFGKQFLDTRALLLPLILAAFFKGLYKLHVHYIFFTKRTMQVTKITFTIGVINIFLSYMLIIKFGLIGAAYSLLIISICQYILTFYVGNKLIPMPWFKRISAR